MIEEMDFENRIVSPEYTYADEESELKQGGRLTAYRTSAEHVLIR